MASSSGPGPSLPDYLIPDRISSKLKTIPAYQQILTQRKASTASRISTKSSLADFVKAKLDDAEAEVQHYTKLHDIADEALSNKTITPFDYDELTSTLQKKRTATEKEADVIKKQRKIVTEDLDDLAQGNITKAEEQYANLLEKCMEQASENFKVKVNRTRFKDRVRKHLKAVKIVGKDSRGRDIKEVWCHALGAWLPPDLITTAHLVPASLKGPEISYAFGVEELSLTDPLLGITLYTFIETALDRGQIIFVPEPQPSGRMEDLKWRIIVTDPGLMDKTISKLPDGKRYKEIHNTYLQFQEGAGRPSRRYFYFRFIMTYIQHKKKNTAAWADELVLAKGYLWATPGPYLREGMLTALAKAGGDVFLPEAWEDMVKKGSFKDVEGCPAKSAEVEKVYSRTLSFEYNKSQSKAGEEKELE